MPIPLTKYNTYTQLQIDLSNNSYLYNNYILTCDLSDTLMFVYDSQNGLGYNNKKVYLNSKASFLMHPFSKCSNSVNKFNNEKPIYKQQNLLQSRCYIPDGTNTCIDNISTQKIIQNQVRVSSNQYINNIKTQYAAINQNDKKYASYDRILARKKAGNLKTDQNFVTPIKGNKDRKYGILNTCVCP